jgi:PKD repeat protein
MADLRANFVPNVIIGNAPLEVAFTNTSQGSFIRVEWNFGDGNKSTDINPVHIFAEDGNFVVTLTTYAADGSSTVFTQTITVLSKQFVEGNPPDSQQALFTFKRFEPGQVAVKKVTTTGSTFTTNSPIIKDGTTYDIDSATTVFSAVVEQASFSAGGATYRIQYLSAGTAINNFLENATDISVAIVMSPTGTTSGAVKQWHNVFPGTGQTDAVASTPVLFYKVASVVTGAAASATFEVDRQLPVRQDDGTGFFAAYFFGVCGATRSYSSLSGSEIELTSSTIGMGIDVGVDKAEKMFFALDSVGGAGWFSANTRDYRGFATYVGYTGNSGSSFTYLYPEHSGASTVNRWYPGNTYLNIPWVMWHENEKSAGLQLYDSADPTQRDAETGLRFRWLRDGQTTNDTIVGQVFHDKQIVLVTDPELTAALTHVNDRSWTLPAPTIKHVSKTGEWVSGGTAGLAPTGCAWYFTYRIVERDALDGTWPTELLGSDYHGFGEANAGLPCQYIQRINVPSGETGVGYFTMTIPKLNFATGGTLCVDNFGNGFVASWLEVLCATGSTTASGPDMNSWRIMTGSPADAAWTGNFATNNTLTIDSTSSYRRDFSGNTYSWGATALSGTAVLHIGNESSPWMFMSGNYASDIYKMSSVCVARNNEFNNTQNMTYDGANDDYVYVTEVGLYNESNELLMVGKLSRPIKKNDQKFVTVKLELDL